MISSNSTGLLPPTGQLVPPTGQFVPARRPSGRVQWTDPGDVLNFMGSESRALSGQGQDILGQGQRMLQPVLQQLMLLLGGDPEAINQAIQPEVAGVVSQYDAAKRAISEFTPRGGGQASAISNMRAGQARDIGMLKATARREATGQLAELGLGQERIGGSLAQTGLQGLSSVLQGSVQEAQNKRAFWSDLGMGIGSIAAMIFAPQLAPWLAGLGAGNQLEPGG